MAAFPTAWSGASGIFVIAAGAVIFKNLRAAGAPRRLALAATAMSGSLGVVLAPCLVVVLIAALNKQVTTTELFSKGLLVFGLTSALFFGAMLWRSRHFKRAAVSHDGLVGFGALKALVPYLLIALGVIVAYGLVLDTWINERTAPYVLPVILLALALWERRRADDDEGVLRPLLSATKETSSHVGALLMLMTASVGLGGIVERSELMANVPDLGGTFTTMTVLVVILILVGMTMDALGAVVLVSVTIASVAYSAGIDPVHFWMVVLVAFELGYLTPPVALNHLLARKVIGRGSGRALLKRHFC